MEKKYSRLAAQQLKRNIASPSTIFFGNVLVLVILFAIIVPNNLQAQTAPSLSYSGPNIYTAGTAISPLVPVSTLKMTAGYSVAPMSLGSGFNNPLGVAADADGNVYVTDNNNSLLKKIPADGSAPVIIGSGFKFPAGVALDAAGNIYVADYGNDAVKKIPAGGGDPVIIGTGFNGPTGIAVDIKGNVYVADRSNYVVKMIPVEGGEPVTIGTDFNYPAGVAVDAAGNVYVADYCNDAVKKIIANGGGTVTIGAGFKRPNDVAVDAAGNVYVADEGNHAVKEILAVSGKTVSLGYGFKNPFGIDVDAAGNVYTGDAGNNAVKKLKPFGGYVINPVLPDGLVFDDETGIISGTPTDDSPEAIYTVTNYNRTDSVSTTVSIKVNNYPPPTITYNPVNNVYTAGIAITPITPVSSDGVYGYTISPDLPAGLSFDGTTGMISGTPETVSPQTSYTVTANNVDTSGTTIINIMVNPGETEAVANLSPEPLVKQAVSPNGDGLNDVLTIENIENYPDNQVTLMNRSGVQIYRVSGYDNATRVFDGHSNITQALQPPGTYFYQLEYKANGELKRKRGYFLLRY